MNLGTNTSSLPWCKISLFSGYYTCETKTSLETEKKFMEVFRAVAEAKSYSCERFMIICGDSRTWSGYYLVTTRDVLSFA